MKSLDGFVKISSLLDNTLGIVSPIGELSTKSMTFSQDVQEYENTLYMGQYELNVFSSLDLLTTAYVIPNAAVMNTVIEVVNGFMSFSSLNLKPLSPAAIVAYINGILGAKVSNLIIGNLVTSSNGLTQLPEWFSFTSLEDNLTTAKIWLADSSFQNQYNKYKIIPTLPLLNIDDFFNLTYVQLKNSISSINISNLVTSTIASQNNKPASTIKLNYFNFVPSVTTNAPISVPFFTSIYSNYGDTIELIKAEICNSILAASLRPRSDWVTIFPDLFKQTEFVLFPRWDLIAIPNLSVQAGLYSPVASLSESITFVTTHLPSYTPVWINNNLQVIPTVYKSLNIPIIGSIDNINNNFKITNVFPDYMAIPTNSLDFNRMTLDTQNWSILLERLLIVAENTVNNGNIPADMRSVVRGTNTFISAVYNNIEYLVFAKSNKI